MLVVNQFQGPGHGIFVKLVKPISNNERVDAALGRPLLKLVRRHRRVAATQHQGPMAADSVVKQSAVFGSKMPKRVDVLRVTYRQVKK